MPFLARCWLIIESKIIPEGFVKWFYLSFYIHPIFLCFCQIVLWIKLLQRWYFLLSLFLCRLILRVSSSCTFILRFLKSLAFFLFASPHTRAADSVHILDEEGAVELENDLPQSTSSQNQLVIYGSPCYNNALHVETYCKVDSILEVKLEETDAVSMDEHSSLIQFDDSFDRSTTSSSSVEVEPNPGGEGSNFSSDSLDTNPPLSSLSTSDVPPLEIDMYSHELLPPICSHLNSEPEVIDGSVKQELDSVYVKYEERMKWFDLLSHDRVYGIDAIQKLHLGRPGLLERMVPADMSWSEEAGEKLMRSLRSDLELVYVAQSCLSWDALHHQYRKVEAIANSNQNRVFNKDTAERFQEFHIFLERFLEDERISTGQRHSNYVRRRFSHKKLLQVPQVSNMENDEMAGEVTNVKATRVLKIIENCIKVFWLFVKADTKKWTWKLKNNLCSSRPPVEDPRDLELLYDLRKIVRKKEQQLKILEGKKEWWGWKRAVNPQVQMEYQKADDFLFTMIDLKLVKNVLQMLTISTSQLHWCQKKLTRIEITERKVYRTQHTHLFPSCS